MGFIKQLFFVCLFVLFVCLFLAMPIWKFLSHGSNPHQRGHSSCFSNNTRALTHCTAKRTPKQLALFTLFNYTHHILILLLVKFMNQEMDRCGRKPKYSSEMAFISTGLKREVAGRIFSYTPSNPSPLKIKINK